MCCSTSARAWATLFGRPTLLQVLRNMNCSASERPDSCSQARIATMLHSLLGLGQLLLREIAHTSLTPHPWRFASLLPRRGDPGPCRVLYFPVVTVTQCLCRVGQSPLLPSSFPPLPTHTRCSSLSLSLPSYLPPSPSVLLGRGLYRPGRELCCLSQLLLDTGGFGWPAIPYAPLAICWRFEMKPGPLPA